MMRTLVSTQSRLTEAVRDEKGAGLAEYALLLVLVTVVVAVILGALATEITNAIQAAINAL